MKLTLWTARVLVAVMLGIEAVGAVNKLTAKAWRGLAEGSFGRTADSIWPEDELSAVLDSKSSSAICFSGGGSRAFQASMGQLGALKQLGLLQDVRYITGTSGGGWATGAFTFHSKNVSDEVFLGAIPDPSKITLDALAVADERSARSFTGRVDAWVREDWRELDDPLAMCDAYTEAVWATFLEPAFVAHDALLNWDETTADAIKEQNPALNDANFAVVSDANGHPYPLINVALLGPLDAVPLWPETHQELRLLEAAPLAVGLPNHGDVTYLLEDENVTLPVGGLVQPHVAGLRAPRAGLDDGAQSGPVTVSDINGLGLTVRETLGWTSFAPGLFLSTLDSEKLDRYTGCQLNYWSPDAASPGEAEAKYLVADGGDVMNDYLVGPLMRGVKHLIMFGNFVTALADASVWDPTTQPPTDDTIEETVCAFFGVPIAGRSNKTSDFDDRSWNYEHSQVFPEEDFVPLVQAMQAQLAAGKGAVVTANHTTVANPVYNIPAGMEVTVTWVYLSHAWDWEAELPSEVTDELNKKHHSEFPNFPHYSTGMLNLTHSQANLLADLTGWIVLNNAAAFEHVRA